MAAPSASPPSPRPWARIRGPSRRCTSRSSCSRGSWPAPPEAERPPPPRTATSGIRPQHQTSRRCFNAELGSRNAEPLHALSVPRSAFPLPRLGSPVLRTSDFDYDLPPELIAQEPLADRAASRLLVLDRAAGTITHRHFGDVVDLIDPADVLVLNASRVIPARLHGRRETGDGTAEAEILLVRELPDGSWIAMGHPGGKLKPGRRVRFGDDSAVEIVERLGGGLRRVRFVGALDARATLARYGAIPLPPYIHRA